MQTLVYIMATVLGSPPSEKIVQTRFSQPVAGTSLSIDMILIQVQSGEHLWVSQDEISWDLYDALVYQLDVPKDGGDTAEAVTRPTKPYLMADRGWGHAGFPALSVSHRGAIAFTEWMSAKTGKLWRLPTVTEWQQLCETSGITAENATEYSWQGGNAGNRTHAIGTRATDANGLRDICGNVAEWCSEGPENWVLMGACYKDHAGDPCTVRKTPSREWNDTDPQIPKSIWWLSDAPFAGFRVVCKSTDPENPALEKKIEEKRDDDRPSE